jgi:hypothetical protein
MKKLFTPLFLIIAFAREAANFKSISKNKAIKDL